MRIGLLLATLLTAMPATAADWVTLFPTAAKHVPRVEIRKGDTTGICSAVVVRVGNDGYGLAASAAHCFDRQPTERMDVTVNGRNGVVVATNSIVDLALVRFRIRGETAIELATASPAAGSDVAILGYAFGRDEMVAQFGRVALNLSKEQKLLLIDGMIAFGDSGGPTIDSAGRLVGINSHVQFAGFGGQMAHLAGVVPIEAVADFLDDFDDRVKKEKP